jgi:hypothetical protein
VALTIKVIVHICAILVAIKATEGRLAVLDDEDVEEGFDQSRYDQISDFTNTPPYKVGLDPDSWAYDLDFPFPEDVGDPDAPAWCVWEGVPDPNELSGVLWEPLGPFGLTLCDADVEVARLLED